MCICSDLSRRGLPRKFSLILTFLFCCNSYSLEAASKPALKPAARLILKDCLFCSKFVWSRTELQQRMQMPFPRLAESALFCANFAVGLICLVCAILLAVTVWKLTAFSADFGGRCGIYGVYDIEPTEDAFSTTVVALHDFYRGKNHQNRSSV